MTSRRPVCDEIGQLVFRGTLHTAGGRFRLRDPFMRDVVAYWFGPSLEATYYASEVRIALRAIDPGFGPTGRELTDMMDVALGYWDAGSGGFKNAVDASAPSLYACAVFHALAANAVATENDDAYDRRRSLDDGAMRKHFPEWAEGFFAFVEACEVPGGGFRQNAQLQPGVIATDRGIRLLSDLRRPIRHLEDHVDYVLREWRHEGSALPGWAGGPASMTATRHSLAVAARYLESVERLRQRFSEEMLARADELRSFVGERRRDSGAYAYEPDESASVVATWDALRLNVALTRMRNRSGVGDQLDPVIDAVTLDPKKLLLFLDCEVTARGIGWIRGAEANLSAIAAAARILAWIAGELKGTTERSTQRGIAEKLNASLERFSVDGHGFAGYPTR